jgi:hypothetical protein
VPEVRPLGPARVLGDDAYVIIEGGILRYDMQGKTVEVVCSQRRNPAQNPMDDPGVRPYNIEFLPGPELEIMASIGGGKSVHYNYAPATRAWRKIESPIPIRPLTESKLSRNPGFLGWAPIFGADTKGPYFLSAGGPFSSGTGIRFDFSTDKEIEEIWRASNGPPVSIHPTGILATQLGWFFLEFDGKYVWFLPLDDLRKYLRENPAAAKIIAEYETKTGAVLVPKGKQSP